MVASMIDFPVFSDNILSYDSHKHIQHNRVNQQENNFAFDATNKGKVNHKYIEGMIAFF